MIDTDRIGFIIALNVRKMKFDDNLFYSNKEIFNPNQTKM